METSFWKKQEKKIFWFTVICAFGAIAIFNFLTPLMSDDYSYSVAVRGVQSFGDLVLNEYHQYMTWTGRSVNHFILKAFLLGDKWFFSLLNSIVFVVLTLLIYYNIEGRGRYNTPLYILVNLFVWLFAVEFGETVLWETGACNYLWGTTNILIAVSLYKYVCSKRDTLKHPVGWALLLFVTGVIGGWCNENTSGGGILLVLGTFLTVWLTDKKKKGNQKKEGKIENKAKYILSKLWLFATPIGMLVGFAFMILAPGNRNRSQWAMDNYGGITKYISRAYKITLSIEDNFMILLLIFLALFIIARTQKVKWKELAGSLFYLFVFVATCYALVMAPTPMNRAYFGAGIFLIMAVLQCFVKVQENETLICAGKKIFIWGMFLHMAFVYVDSVVNVARIYRDFDNRHEYILAQKQAGVTNITVPLLHEGFETKYSFGYNTDFGEDAGYWINILASEYYGVESISCVPMEEWTIY